MKRKLAAILLTIGLLMSAFAGLPPTASSKSSLNALNRHASRYSATLLPMLVTNLDVDRTDDNAGATACTPAANDCSLRGAIINANSDPGVDPIVINLQPATTYSLTLPNATQENAAATGDLDITTTLHSVTILGGGSSTVIDAAGLTSGNMHDRAFQITGSGVTVLFQDLTIRNGQAADDGSSGASTNPASHNATRAGGCILNGAGIDVNLQAVTAGGSVTLDGVTIEACQTLGKGDDQVNQNRTLDAWGGGLASLANLSTTGNVNITGTTFTGNTALGGDGGHFNNGNGSGTRGGAIYFGGGTLNIDGSRIDNNDATGGKGADTNDISNQQNGGQGGSAQGGGAWVAGTATINNTTFESCAATGGNAGNGQNAGNSGGESGGGGLYSVGSVTVTNSTFNQNSSTGGRSGDSFGPDCFGAHQSCDGGAARGGAILADAGSLIVNTATLANNSAEGGDGGNGGKTNGGGPCAQTTHGAGGLAYGGAITNNIAATLNIKHATISGNSALAGNTGVNQGGANLPPRLVAEGTGGGIRVGAPLSVTLENTIIANNTAANGTGDGTGAPTPGPDVDGTVTSSGHNLIGNATEAIGFTGTGDLIGANPNLAPLANNGGPTETMELLPGSDAIDAGVAAGSTFDQRGLPRTVNDPGVPDEATSDGTDIGAFETEVPCILECPDDISVPNDLDECGAVVNYTEPSGAGCGIVTCDRPSGSFFDVGETTVTCTSTAGPSCSFKVTVTDEQDPTISCPTDITVNAPVGTCSATVNFTVTGSDNCADPTIVSSPASGSVFPVGTTTVTSTATDAAGNSTNCTFDVTVKDVTAPVITLNGQNVAFWPPNHKYRTINVTDLVASASDLCDAGVGINSVVIASVSSDEVEDAAGGGDGNTLNDIVIAGDCKSVQLRSERMGGGNGRVYTITFKVTDASGNVSTATAKVTVPHSQNGAAAVDDGPSYNVNGCP